MCFVRLAKLLTTNHSPISSCCFLIYLSGFPCVHFCRSPLHISAVTSERLVPSDALAGPAQFPSCWEIVLGSVSPALAALPAACRQLLVCCGVQHSAVCCVKFILVVFGLSGTCGRRTSTFFYYFSLQWRLCLSTLWSWTSAVCQAVF